MSLENNPRQIEPLWGSRDIANTLTNGINAIEDLKGKELGKSVNSILDTFNGNLDQLSRLGKGFNTDADFSSHNTYFAQAYAAIANGLSFFTIGQTMGFLQSGDSQSLYIELPETLTGIQNKLVAYKVRDCLAVVYSAESDSVDNYWSNINGARDEKNSPDFKTGLTQEQIEKLSTDDWKDIVYFL